MTEQEISLITGDVVRTIRGKYFSKDAVQDGTRAIAGTDRRIKEERLRDSGYQSLIQEKEAEHRRVLAQKEQENIELRQRLDNIEKTLAEAKDNLISGQLAINDDRIVYQQQLEVSRELLEEFRVSRVQIAKTESLEKPLRGPEYFIDKCRDAYLVKLLRPKWFDTSGISLQVTYDSENESFYNEGEVHLVCRLVNELLKRRSEDDLILIISPQNSQAVKLANNFKKERNVRVEGPFEEWDIKVADIVIISFVTWNFPADDDCLFNFYHLYMGLNTAWRKVYLLGNYKEACRRVNELSNKSREGVFEYFTTLFQPSSDFERNLISATTLTEHNSSSRRNLMNNLTW